jgi:hypothetical protein
MTLLPCDLDPIQLRVVVNGYWDLEALREHVSACRRCASLGAAMAAMTGSQGGATGRGAAKRRGSSEYYRALAARRSNP